MTLACEEMKLSWILLTGVTALPLGRSIAWSPFGAIVALSFVAAAVATVWVRWKRDKRIPWIVLVGEALYLILCAMILIQMANMDSQRATMIERTFDQFFFYGFTTTGIFILLYCAILAFNAYNGIRVDLGLNWLWDLPVQLKNFRGLLKERHAIWIYHIVFPVLFLSFVAAVTISGVFLLAILGLWPNGHS